MTPPPPDIRASDADREAAADRIQAAAAEGRLDSSELDKRLGAVYAARWRSELNQLTADITLPPPPPIAAYVPQPQAVQADSTNGYAITSLISSLCWMGWLGSIVGIVTGHIALSQINKGQGTGQGMAIAGLVIGYLSLIPAIYLMLFILSFL